MQVMCNYEFLRSVYQQKVKGSQLRTMEESKKVTLGEKSTLFLIN